MATDPRQRRRDFIQMFWTIACEDRLCINCGCGRSLVPREEDHDPDDYRLTS